MDANLRVSAVLFDSKRVGQNKVDAVESKHAIDLEIPFLHFDAEKSNQSFELF
jgi:hypothetical protein